MCRVTVVPVLMYGAEVCVQGHCGASVNVWSRGVCILGSYHKNVKLVQIV